MNPLVVILGPTGVGKSQLALRLARRLDGEILSADSRQVYRYMDIGTAKPSLEERKLVPHHLIDLVDPDEEFNLALFLELTNRKLEEVRSRGRIPLLVGGTGLYIWAFLEGWRLPPAPPNLELRKELEERARVEGIDSLHQELWEVDPEAAQKIDPRNVKRVIRALEVYRVCGRRFSELSQRSPLRAGTLIIGLHLPRPELYRRIDLRVEEMIRKGLVEEVHWLLEQGYSPSLPSMSGVGYRQICQYLQGGLSLPEAVQRIKYETHRFARHQYAWFRLEDERIHWLEVGKKVEEQALKLIRDAFPDPLASGIASQVNLFERASLPPNLQRR